MKRWHLIFPCFLLLLPLLTAGPEQASLVDLVDLTIGPPVPAIPFYHFRGRIVVHNKTPFEVAQISVNGKTVLSYEFRDASADIDPGQPFDYSWPLFAAEKNKELSFGQAWLIGRLDWENGKSYRIELHLSLNKGKVKRKIEKSVQAPLRGGYWHRDWKSYKSLVISENHGLARVEEPVEFSLVFYPDQVTDLENELRIVEVNSQGETRVLPCQIYSTSLFEKKDEIRLDASGQPRPPYWLPSLYAKVVAPVSLAPHSSVVLLAFYGNPSARATKPKSDLLVTGKNLDLTIENQFYRIRLHPLSGMLDEILVKSLPQIALQHKLETNGAIHWNPDAYSPPRPWVHASDWNPPQDYRVVVGPLMVAIHRSGTMPLMPEIKVGITYQFFAGQPYFTMTSFMEILQDVPLQALRNGEIVFDHKYFDRAAWERPGKSDPQTVDLSAIPLLTEIQIPLETQWLAFFHSKNGVAFAGIPLESHAIGPGLDPLTYNPYLYIIRGPWVYWCRALVVPYFTQNMQQIITVPAGNVYWEKWAYLPFQMADKVNVFKPIQSLQQTLSRPLQVRLIDDRDARVQIPDEIYTDPTKTGWEKKPGQ